MATLTPGQIYLADRRGLTDGKTLRRLSTFNYGTYHDDSRQSFGKLLVCNEELLAASATVELTIDKACHFVVIPITGEVHFRLNGGELIKADVGTIHTTYVAEGSTIDLLNPYDNDWINYVYFMVDAGVETNSSNAYTFDFTDRANELITLFTADSSHLPVTLQIGQFEGRTEALYKLTTTESQLFAFVIAGAFELQGRLLHERDGLSLEQPPEVELEALSNGAVVILVSW